ncbi:uncharacterized protein PHACADRAFT_250636 [Phanerochaete carnosa HHB-10118-sp]|uniref:RNase III domain-containing protein n=1 Tax=Phanerochaete carnosa (strain HHB-10118-sp) TaxID=650164 RepID=K5WL34_PHACS|nr:uncharacterized protein PHACADRAFT_250636 [Phanerochaete carnosa HHB-10118-sp]EKM59864.1 hypothetical protein PHACADRAFT_250636 [Phanerochaete carnosa HHB-10118-sp]
MFLTATAMGRVQKKPCLSPHIEPQSLPPLPDIFTEELRRQVFMHRSYYARPTNVFEDSPDDPSPDNEALEHLGDTVLNMVVTELIQEIYPHVRVGPSTKMRSLVVGNQNLATITRMYGLNDRLVCHHAQEIALKASHNIQANLFEAYVGGLYMDRGMVGLEDIKRWMRALFRPWLSEAYRVVRIEHGLSPDPEPSPTRTDRSLGAPSRVSPSIGHLSLFNQYLQQKNIVVEWVYKDSAGEGTRTTPVWIVRAMVDQECLGRGRGNTKKAARNEAAKEGLQKMGVYVPQPVSQDI